ncbi:mitochondrial escape protein 2, partial [Rhizoclosmatium hyalinum]
MLNYIRDHPRVSLPIILALLAFLSFLIFDPMRVFFVTNEITERFSLKKYSSQVTESVESVKDLLMRWLFGRIPQKKTEEDGLSDALKERKEYESRLMTYLKETPETALLIHGPKGTKSVDLIDKCTKNEPYVLRIKLDELINQPDHIMLDRLASQIGCFPMFNWLVSSGSILDTLFTAGTGMKAGLSSTSIDQVRKIFEIATIAMNRITAEQEKSHQAAVDKHHRLEQQGALSEKEKTTFTLPDIEYPIVVIEGFLENEKAKQAFVYEALAEWAGMLTDLHIAQ